MVHNPKFVVLVGPSGVGKSTIGKLIRERNPDILYLPSVTDREMRPGESQGSPYTFLSKEEFTEKVENNELLEWIRVHGLNRYGTPIAPAQEAIDSGSIVFKEMDTNGLKDSLAKPFGRHIVSIFLTPPDEETLIHRITSRGAMSKEELEKRLESARQELKDSDICDYKIVAEEGKVEDIYEQVMNAIEEATN